MRIGNILSCFPSEDVASMEGASGMVSMLSRGNLNQNVLCISCFPKRCRIFIQLCSRDEKQLSSYSYRDHHPSIIHTNLTKLLILIVRKARVSFQPGNCQAHQRIFGFSEAEFLSKKPVGLLFDSSHGLRLLSLSHARKNTINIFGFSYSLHVILPNFYGVKLQTSCLQKNNY